MRSIKVSIFIGLVMALGMVAPVLATSGDDPGKSQDANVTVWCSVDTGTQIDVKGDLAVHDGSSGSVTLWLYGSKDGKSWVSTGQSIVVDLVKGQTVYGFSFNTYLDSTHFSDYKVSGDGAWSRVINEDECGFRVPEAPASSLLLLGALPAAGLMALTAAGVKIRRPRFQRVA